MLRQVNARRRRGGGLLLPPLGDRPRAAAHRRHRPQDALSPLREHPPHGSAPATACSATSAGAAWTTSSCTARPRLARGTEPWRAMRHRAPAPQTTPPPRRAGTPSSWPARRPPSSTAPAGRRILRQVFRHDTHYPVSRRSTAASQGVLPLAHVNSLLFGNALVSLPFAVYGGVAASDEDAAAGAGAARRSGWRSAWAWRTSNCATCSRATPTGRGRTCT